MKLSLQLTTLPLVSVNVNLYFATLAVGSISVSLQLTTLDLVSIDVRARYSNTRLDRCHSLLC